MEKEGTPRVDDGSGCLLVWLTPAWLDKTNASLLEEGQARTASVPTKAKQTNPHEFGSPQTPKHCQGSHRPYCEQDAKGTKSKRLSFGFYQRGHKGFYRTPMKPSRRFGQSAQCARACAVPFAAACVRCSSSNRACQGDNRRMRPVWVCLV